MGGSSAFCLFFLFHYVSWCLRSGKLSQLPALQTVLCQKGNVTQCAGCLNTRPLAVTNPHKPGTLSRIHQGLQMRNKAHFTQMVLMSVGRLHMRTWQFGIASQIETLVYNMGLFLSFALSLSPLLCFLSWL